MTVELQTCGDILDENASQLEENRMPEHMLPVIKLNEECFLVGTKIMEVSWSGNACMVQTGGGAFEKLQDFIFSVEKQEIRHIEKMLQRNEGSVFGEIQTKLKMKNFGIG